MKIIILGAKILSTKWCQDVVESIDALNNYLDCEGEFCQVSFVDLDHALTFFGYFEWYKYSLMDNVVFNMCNNFFELVAVRFNHWLIVLCFIK